MYDETTENEIVDEIYKERCQESEEIKYYPDYIKKSLDIINAELDKIDDLIEDNLEDFYPHIGFNKARTEYIKLCCAVMRFERRINIICKYGDDFNFKLMQKALEQDSKEYHYND